MFIVTLFQVSMTSFVFQSFRKIEFSGVDLCFYERVPSDANVWFLELAGESALQFKGYAEDLE
jgi:hypothetical protein